MASLPPTIPNFKLTELTIINGCLATENVWSDSQEG